MLASLTLVHCYIALHRHMTSSFYDLQLTPTPNADSLRDSKDMVGCKIGLLHHFLDATVYENRIITT